MALKFFALAILIVLALTVIGIIWLLGSLPGKVARSRGHAQADAVAIAGWCSLLMPLPLWPLAMVWAYMAEANGTATEEAAQ
ncbi:MAG: hypothetical protein C0606_05450 [Hyphomicrobiales bacterium]|nr:MAG: hypothetical protein C0606_05450 [Hyphomicrobiales bacterium]